MLCTHLLILAHPLFLNYTLLLVSEYEVHAGAEERDNHYQQNPRELVLGGVVTDEHQDGHHNPQHGPDQAEAETGLDIGQRDVDDAQLYEDEEECPE